MDAVLLTRGDSTDQGTPGVLVFGDHVVCTMELPWRDNQRQISCIPIGVYALKWRKSPKFGWCYEVTDVPNRSNVLIHAANLAGDAALGWTTQLQGCIAPCRRIGLMRNKAGVMQLAGLVSRPALIEFDTWGAKRDLTLEVRS